MSCDVCNKEWEEKPSRICGNVFHWQSYVMTLEADKNDSYIFFADKPISNHSYRGGSDDYWDDTVFEFGKTRDEVVVQFARCLLVNKGLHIDEKGYDPILIFKGGHPLPSNPSLIGNKTGAAEYQEYKKMYEEADKLATLWDKEAKEREAEKIATQKLEQEKRNEDFQRKQYEALKKKFEDK
jgi:hypothetical protein